MTATLLKEHTIKCGSCKGTHATAFDVRCCYLSKNAPTPVPAAPVRLDFSAIPDGNYAVRQDGVVKFYRVSTKGRFKNVQVRASDALHMQYGKAGIAILHRIVAAGLEASQMLFATELGCCWMCGKTLTDEESRAQGVGPICREK